MHVHFGDDSYGAVKYVGGFHVATTFFHVNSFPVWPMQSMVLGPRDEQGHDMQALLLASIDRHSVVIAYVRGVAGALIVLGFIPLLFGFMFWLLNDGQTDIPPSLIMSIGGVTVASGTMIGTASYLVWRTPKPRERHIRRIAHKQLGAAVDPASLVPSLSSHFAELLESRLLVEGIHDYSDAIRRSHEYPEEIREKVLLRVRCEMSLAGPNAQHEFHTDSLLRGLTLPTVFGSLSGDRGY